jgi:hypothetical protein
MIRIVKFYFRSEEKVSTACCIIIKYGVLTRRVSASYNFTHTGEGTVIRNEGKESLLYELELLLLDINNYGNNIIVGITLHEDKVVVKMYRVIFMLRVVIDSLIGGVSVNEDVMIRNYCLESRHDIFS